MTRHPLRDIANAYLSLLRAIGTAFRRGHVIVLVAMTSLVALAGAAVMMLLEGWGPIDAFYFAVVTMATVGYGDFAPQTAAGKLFTVGYLVIGIGIFVLTVGAVAEAILSAMPGQNDDQDKPPR